MNKQCESSYVRQHLSLQRKPEGTARLPESLCQTCIRFHIVVTAPESRAICSGPVEEKGPLPWIAVKYHQLHLAWQNLVRPKGAPTKVAESHKEKAETSDPSRHSHVRQLLHRLAQRLTVSRHLEGAVLTSCKKRIIMWGIGSCSLTASQHLEGAALKPWHACAGHVYRIVSAAPGQ